MSNKKDFRKLIYAQYIAQSADVTSIIGLWAAQRCLGINRHPNCSLHVCGTIDNLHNIDKKLQYKWKNNVGPERSTLLLYASDVDAKKQNFGLFSIGKRYVYFGLYMR